MPWGKRPRLSVEAREARRQQRREQVAPIFAYLDRRGITRAWLSRALGISDARIWNYERGLNQPPDWFWPKTLEALEYPSELSRVYHEQQHAQRLASKALASVRGPPHPLRSPPPARTSQEM